MSVEMIGFLALILVLILIFLRVPVTISMLLVSFLGIYFLRGFAPLNTAIHTIIWNQSFSYLLTTIPMFILMGEFIYMSGISQEIFNMFRKWFGRLKGGLGISTVGASAMFAAASGSSVATTGTIGVMALKEMQKYGYSNSLASGTIAAGGTLGILIPPSTSFIIYGMLTEQSIGRLLIAGIVPGILLTIFFMLTVYLSIMLQPNLAAEGERVPLKEKFKSLSKVIWIMIVFLVVIGGMYMGWFSPTEAAGVGAVSTFLIALFRRKMTRDLFIASVSRTLSTTGFIFAIILGSFLLNYLLTITRVPILIADFLTSSSLSPLMILILIILMYIILGALMDALAMIVVTIPIVIPVIQALGYDLVWFGVIIVLVIELALITPPIGMNIFVLKGIAPDLKIGEIFLGASRFIIAIVVLITILIIFPELALFLPDRVG
ncbi:TRAP transporter large permease [Metabacillus arenae]|uniref:TRAP transporter large permease n=1 Tax=Metabacillus arenae TaxID=2771434 RepID=A0A926NCI9_9BACI|nr:TRAP transporter large permease [Metabacillus arenae]MBD1380999.1 TRAP transporter large permease [Metabacillus arenae]